jgi:hypothetical protein
MSVLSITFTGEDGRPLTALHTVLVICSHVHTPSSKKKRRMCSTHEFPLPNQDSPPSIHQSNILRPLFEHPPSSHLLTSHKNLQTSRSTERSARTDQGDNRLRSGEKRVRGEGEIQPLFRNLPSWTGLLQNIFKTLSTLCKNGERKRSPRAHFKNAFDTRW